MYVKRGFTTEMTWLNFKLNLTFILDLNSVKSRDVRSLSTTRTNNFNLNFTIMKKFYFFILTVGMIVSCSTEENSIEPVH